MSDIGNTIKAVKLCLVLLETIDDLKDAGGIPSGHAYIAFMSMMNIDQFQGMLSGLTKVRAIKVEHDFISPGKEFHSIMKSYKDLNVTFDKKMNELKQKEVGAC